MHEYEDIISSTIQVVSEALKGGIVPVYAIYAQLLLKNIKLEYELKQLRECQSSSLKNENAHYVFQNDKFTTKPLSHSSKINSIEQSKEAMLSDTLQPLFGCQCHFCRYAFLQKKTKGYKIKSKEIRKLYDNHWAIYRGVTICEILYIGHKRNTSRLDQSKTRRRIIGATIRFPPDDVKEFFVPLHDLYPLKTSECRFLSATYPNDSGYGTSVDNCLQVNLGLGTIKGSSFMRKNFLDEMKTPNFSKHSSVKSNLLLSPSDCLLSADRKCKNMLNQSSFNKNIDHSVSHTDYKYQSHGRYLDHLHGIHKVPCLKTRRGSLQNSSNCSLSHYLEMPRRTSSSDVCDMTRRISTCNVDDSVCSCNEISRPSFSTCDSAISLSSTNSSLRNCCSTRELCHHYGFKPAPILATCEKANKFNNHYNDCCCLSCRYERRNCNDRIYSHCSCNQKC